jgi:hypothetical protein
MHENVDKKSLPKWIRSLGIVSMLLGIAAGFALLGRPWGFIVGGMIGGTLLGTWTAYWQKRLG